MTDATDDAIDRRVIEIIAGQAGADPADIRPDAAPGDLGVDSLGMVETIFAIEEAFDISVPFNANDPSQGDFDISTVAGIVAGVKRLIAEQRG